MECLVRLVVYQDSYSIPIISQINCTLPGFVVGKTEVGCDGSGLVRHDEVAFFGRPTSVKQRPTISPINNKAASHRKQQGNQIENEKENREHVIQQPQMFRLSS